MEKVENEELPGTAWEIQVDKAMREHNAREQEARDLVIIQWLNKGDTRPFTDFVTKGHKPSAEVIKYIAWMMNPLDGSEDTVPFSLKVNSRRRRGRRSNPEIEVRDRLLADNVKRQMSEGSSYNQALDYVAELYGEDLAGDQRDTVEKAYKRYK